MYANWFLQVNVYIMDSSIPLTLIVSLRDTWSFCCKGFNSDYRIDAIILLEVLYPDV